MSTKIKASVFLFIAYSACFPFNVFSVNPDLSNYLINLSEGSEGPGMMIKYLK
jgi:hypothetical protein